ncbi:hypothetical protein [Streptomyces niveus]|uniref:hypothetical protein n=1 Tax=Streptomyces niveus TaxID=193462 RepID=UPI0003C5B57C|nr:hypothetical protein [Streptomyces niveus]EST22795.1 hypothetical protein M877_28880 [Streptomyces niveus NCIMB 11891]
MSDEIEWFYAVQTPRGSAGWVPYGDHPEQWTGTITTEDAEYVAATVTRDLAAAWQRNGSAPHVRVCVWDDAKVEPGDVGPDVARLTVEVQPDLPQ